MLVYVRDSQLADAVRPVTMEDIPRALVERFEREQDDARRREEALLNAAKYITLEVRARRGAGEGGGVERITALVPASPSCSRPARCLWLTARR